MALFNRFLTTATINEDVAFIPTTTVQERGQCFFLDLPGEIQNRIYDFAREGTHVCFKPSQSRVAPAKAQERVSDMEQLDTLELGAFKDSVNQYSGSPSEVGDFPFTTTEDDDARRLKKSLRHFRGLTQVCRAIWHEFLPLYKEHTMYRIGHLNLQDYMETVLQKGCDEVAHRAVEAAYDPQIECIGYTDYLEIWQREEIAHRKQIHRNIVVDYKYSDEYRVDILPFLLFLGTAQNIFVKCGKNFCPRGSENSMSGLRPYLDKLFAVFRHSKLLR